MSTKRLKPDWAFPPYAFRPGSHPHPHKAGGHGLGRELEENPLGRKQVGDLATSPHFLFALDLYNYAYYWEAHVYWEALWNAFGRQGRDAWALQGLIKMAAAGLKYAAGQSAAAKGHLERAEELFVQAQRAGGGNPWCRLDLAALIAACGFGHQGEAALKSYVLEPQG